MIEQPSTASTTVAAPPGAGGGAERVGGDAERLGARATRTRNAILEAARRLILERGYLGTTVSDITDACRISRAGFYTYFKDKREIFNVLGESAYRDILEVVGQWDRIPRPATAHDVRRWVSTYFGYMDRHGAFVLATGQYPPSDEDIRAGARRMQMRVAFLLGISLRSRQRTPTDAPETLGLAIMAMLDRSWHFSQVQGLPVDRDELVRTTSQLILQALE